MLLLVGASLLGSASCSKSEDKPFSDTPSVRSDKAVRKALETLQASPYGWQMTIFPSAELTFGGYTVFINFGTDGTASISDELQDDFRTSTTSLYAVDNSNGPTLTFNTYNPAIHRYSEPNSAQFDGSLALGADGDYSYQIMKVEAERIELRGIRSGVTAILTPLKTADWAPLLTAIKSSATNNYLPSAQLQFNGQTISGARMTAKRHLVFDYRGRSYDLPFRYTDTGIELYEALSIGGKSVQTFVNQGTPESPILTDASGTVSISNEGNLGIILMSAVWRYSPANATGRFAEAISKLNSYLASEYRGRVETDRMFFGMISDRLQLLSQRFFYNSSASGGSRLMFTPELISGNEIKISYDHAGSLAFGGLSAQLINFRNAHMLASGFSNVGKIDGLIDDGEGNYEGRTFILTAEPNAARPSWITLTEKDNPSNSLKLDLFFYN